MENAQKAIMIGVGLFITIILITAVMAITGIGTGLLDQGQQQISGLSAQLTSQLTSKFDENQMSGAQVLAEVQSYYDNTQLVVMVNNGSSNVFATANIIDGVATSNPKAGRIECSDSPKYDTSARPSMSKFSSTTGGAARIIPTAMYDTYLITVNDGVVGIAFYKK